MRTPATRTTVLL